MKYRRRIKSAFVFVLLVGILFGALALIPTLAQAPRHGRAAPDESFAQMMAPSLTGYTIDNSDGAPGFTVTGTWNAFAGGYKGNGLWTPADSSGELAVWRPDLDAGWYQIQVHYWANSDPNTQRDDAPYTIHYDDNGTPAEVTRHVNQKLTATGAVPIAGGEESGWLTLIGGPYHFTAGTAGYVSMSDVTTTWGTPTPGNFVADAVRFLPLEVWVDDNYSAVGTNDGHLWGVNAFGTIPDGVHAVADGGTVWVNPGSYLQNITVTKGITLYGVSVGNDRPVVTVTVGTAIDVRASNVTVTGFNVGTAAAAYGISNFGTGPGIQNVRIINNWVHGFQYGICFDQFKAEISGNHVQTSTFDHIYVQNSITGTVVSGNIITGSLSGDHGIQVLDEAGDILVSGNRITGCSEGVRVWHTAAHTLVIQKVSVQGNTITGGVTGIHAGRDAGTNAVDRTLLIGGAYTTSVPNTLYANTGDELQLETVGAQRWRWNIDAAQNYWGFCTLRDIEQRIYHYYDQPLLAPNPVGNVTYEPALCVPYSIDVQAAPASLPADGFSTSVVTATVLDVSNRRVDVGTMVGFTSTNGGLPVGYVEAEALTTTAGFAGPVADAYAAGGNYISSNVAGSTASWRFKGPAVSLIGLVNSNGGSAQVAIDALGVITTVSFYTNHPASPLQYQVEWPIKNDLDPGWHNITITVQPGGNWVHLDALRSGVPVNAAGQAVTTLTAPFATGTGVVWGTVYNGRIITASGTLQFPYIQDTAAVNYNGADVYVTKTALPTALNPGQEVTYSISYGNAGPATATGVLVTDTLPANFTRVRSSSVPNYEGPNPFAGNKWVWTIGNVAPGATGSITLVAQPGLTGWTVPTLVTNVVQIGSVVAESSWANNQSSAAVTVVPSIPAGVTVTVVPNILPANGWSNAAVTATVNDIHGNPVVNGTVVTFSTSLTGCGFEPTGTTPKVVTTSGGVAVATLRAGTLAGTTVITAQAGTAYGKTTATLVPQEPWTVAMTARPAWIRVSPFGELTTTLYITVTDINGNKVDGARVNLTTTAGSFVGSGATTLAVTTTQGITVAGLASACTPTWVTVTAGITTTGRPTTSLSVEFKPGLPATITAVADPVAPTPIRVCGGASGTAVVTATIIDSCGNLVEDGTEVSFNVVEGERGDTYPRLTRTLNGVASTLVRTKAYRFGERFLNVYILSRRESRDITSTQRIDLEVGYASQMTLTPSPATIQVNNKRSIIRAIVSDCAGNPVQNGTTVTFTADALGTVSPTVTTTFDGLAQTTFESGCTTGDAVVTAMVDSRTFTTTVKLEAGPPLWIYAQIDDNKLLNCGGRTTVRATVYDACFNLVKDDTPVQFSPLYGYVSTSPVLGYTRRGVVTTTVTAINKRLDTWPENLEQVDVTSPGSNPGFVSLRILPGAISNVDVQATPGSIAINGDVNFEDITVVARVVDCSGTPVTNTTPVRLETTLGIFRNSGQRYYNTWTDGGLVTGTLTSQAEAGKVTITAIAGVVTDTTTVTFVPGPPWTVEVTAVPYHIPADGRSSSQIFAGVKDFYGNYVMEGVTLTFVTDYGYFYESGVVSHTTHTNAQGFCQARLVSSTTPQTVQVIVIAYNDRQGYTYVFFETAPTTRYIYMPLIRKRIVQ